MTLTEFLLARIAEDEADCADLAAIGSVMSGPPYWSTARYAAECQAKRRIVEHFTWDDLGNEVTDPEGVLGILATIYADHPDYREDWRP